MSSSSAAANNAHLLAGKEIYETAPLGCATCHGLEGEGNAAQGGPSLKNVKDSYSSLSLEEYINRNMIIYIGACANTKEECSNNVAAYIRNGFSTVANTSSSSSSSSSGWVDQTQPIASCDVTYGPRGLRVLTRNEFVNSVEYLTGINILRDLGATVYASLPADNLISGFSNNVMANIEPGSLQGYSTAVSRLVDKLAESNFASVVSCAEGEEPGSCGMKLIDGFLPKVLRRSLSESEITAYGELFSGEYTGGSANEGLKLALRTAFTSPDFLYRDETGVSIVEIEEGNSNSGPEYEPVGTVQVWSFNGDTSVDPGYYAGNNVNFVDGYNLIEIVAKALVGSNGNWPVLEVDATGYSESVPITSNFNRVYRVLVPAGKVVGGQHLKFRTDPGPGHIMLDSVKVSGAREKVITAPPVVLDRDAYVLTPYQLASYLAFTFTGTTPDDELLTAAREEGLETKAQIEAQVERLLATERARKHFGDHITQWLRADRLQENPKSPEYFADFTPAVRSAMLQEIRDIYTHVLLDEGESFTDMFGGDFTFVNQALASFYGIAGVSGEQMRKVAVTDRGGLMASGAFMTVNAHAIDNAPILRSVYFRKAFMCQDVPAPPTGVSLTGEDVDALREESIRLWEAKLAAQGGKATPREKYEFQTSAPLCAACHEKMINPLGGVMEDFNAVGQKISVHYNGLPVDAVGTLFGVTDARGYDHEVYHFNGAKQLAAEASQFSVTQSCFIDNNFRMAMGTGSTYFDRSMGVNLTRYEKSNYACEVQKLDSIMKAANSNGSAKAMLKALGSLDSVRYRKDVQR